MSAWVGLAGFGLSLLVSIISVTAMVVTMKNQVTRLTEQERKQELREDEAAQEAKEMFVLLREFIARQTEINKTVEIGLTGVIGQLREMEKRTVEASTVVSLLTEVIKKAEIKGLSIQP